MFPSPGAGSPGKAPGRGRCRRSPAALAISGLQILRRRGHLGGTATVRVAEIGPDDHAPSYPTTDDPGNPGNAAGAVCNRRRTCPPAAAMTYLRLEACGRAVSIARAAPAEPSRSPDGAPKPLSGPAAEASNRKGYWPWMSSQPLVPACTWTPPHGFCRLEPNTEVVYKVPDFYSAVHDRGPLGNDPDLRIEWGSRPTRPCSRTRIPSIRGLAGPDECF